MASNLKIAIVQADLVWEDIEANLKKFDNLLTLVEGNSDVIVLPEMFTTGFTMNCENVAESMNGSAVKWMKAKAKSLEAAVVGSLVIKEDGQFYNRLIWMHPNGKIEKYDKKHLFTLSGEHHSYKAGDERQIVNYKNWKICPLICYDLRFPEWSRNRLEYDALIYTANWPETRSDHWRTLLKARAIENQCFTIGVNRVGMDGIGLKYQGDTSAYRFDGTLLVHSKDEESVDHIELSKVDLEKFRMKLPFLEDQEGISQIVNKC